MAGANQHTQVPRQNHTRDQMTALAEVENQILTAMQSAATSLAEMGKDKIGMKAAETNANTFLKEVEDIENKLTKQISQLTQYAGGSGTEVSPYGQKKDFNMAMHRNRHAETILERLQELKNARENPNVQENAAS
ncbi:DgyrCDS321 [Dimorphilus gyrociliatus]|uniref:Mediator of RNA polymerase II transcription subunit 11 n=1 Tax=Dimorphilus gyrociliatus TaxID=2664684 RepID=A0A7I8V8N0_9ANNE|nr:DgyrCDS321 [Dimorphilus gyrociliatus]